MRVLFESLLRISGLADPDQIRRAQLMVVGGLATIAYLLAVSVEGAVDHNLPLILLPLAVALLATAAIVSARRGRLIAAEWITAALVLTATAAVVALQGLVSARLGIIHVCVMFLGLAARPWMAPVSALLAATLVLGAVVAREWGVPIPLSPSGQPAFIGVIRQVLLGTAIMAAFTHGFQRLLASLARHTSQLEDAHAELLAARDRLEGLVAKRSTEIERANADLESFASSAAHDLRAPLRHVHGFLELFVGDAADLGPGRLAAIREARDLATALSAKVEAILARGPMREPRPG